jgi:hypothetical protein
MARLISNNHNYSSQEIELIIQEYLLNEIQQPNNPNRFILTGCGIKVLYFKPSDFIYASNEMDLNDAGSTASIQHAIQWSAIADTPNKNSTADELRVAIDFGRYALEKHIEKTKERKRKYSNDDVLKIKSIVDAEKKVRDHGHLKRASTALLKHGIQIEPSNITNLLANRL